MRKNALKKSEIEDLEKLCKLAAEQNNMINMNLVYMSLKITDNIWLYRRENQTVRSV